MKHYHLTFADIVSAIFKVLNTGDTC